ncbi:PA14 domain-containing protein, partial [Neobacillus drentensis]|uniref:PA14 domain-containing protein n=1 Tax=Neobacillus drentensis TaxID=220684 RepID=UPI002FFF178A
MSSKNLIKVSLIGLLSSVFVPNNLVYANENSDPVYKPAPQKEVHYNWGYGSPASGFPIDHFKAEFDQSGTYAKGDYFLQTFADDGVKVEVDGVTKINRWTDYTGGIEKALWLGVTDGQHSVKTSYYENVSGAGVFSDIVPFGSWLAYYYPNDSLSGMPASAKVISTEKLSEKFPGSPAKGIGADHFSARYTTAKRISAGDYMLNLNADDGIRVYVDGKLVVDRWQKPGEDRIKLTISDSKDAKEGEKDVHWIEVEYREDILNGYVDVSLTPFPVLGLKTGKEAHYNWGYGSPASGYPSDYFVADIDQSGTYAKGDYFLQTFADDGVKVEVDGETKINRWTDYTGGMEKALWLGVAEGQHTVKTRYLENVAAAGVFSDVVPFGSWLAYYYPNDSLSGMPAAAKVISTDKLSEKFPGSPAAGIGADHFSARYTTAKRIAAGDYVLKLNADDGIRVYVDGKLVADRWQKFGADLTKLTISDRTDAKAGEKDVHWI